MNEFQSANIFVCICTKNREESTLRLVDSIINTKYQNVRLLIADSTEPKTRFDQFNSSLNSYKDLAIEHIYVKGGLPTARNVCIENLAKDEILIFFDDDVTIPENFFTVVGRELAKSEEITAAGVRISGLYTQGKTLWNRVGNRMRAGYYGKVTSSGENIWFPDIEFPSSPAEWIPGCCMIFKSRAFDKLRFNENLEKGPGRNYALGEDMDFTLRLSESQEVIAIGSTYVNHHYAPSKRDDEVLIAGATGTLYAYLLNVFPSRFSKKRMIVGTSLKYFWATRFIHPVRFVKLLTEFLQHLQRELKHKSLEG